MSKKLTDFVYHQQESFGPCSIGATPLQKKPDPVLMQHNSRGGTLLHQLLRAIGQCIVRPFQLLRKPMFHASDTQPSVWAQYNDYMETKTAYRYSDVMDYTNHSSKPSP